MIKKMTFGVAISVCLAGAASAAQSANELVFSMGIASAVHEDGIHLKDSFAGSVAYFRRLHPWIAAGLEGGLFIGAKYGGIVPTPVDSDGDGQADKARFNESAFSTTLFLTPEIKLGPILGEENHVRWQPYLVGGGGVYRVVFAETDNAPGPVSSHSNHGGFHGGGGLSVFFPSGVGVSAEIRFHQVIDRGAPDTVYRVPSIQVHFLF